MKYGEASGVYTKMSMATTDKVSQDDMCGAPANTTGWHDLGLIHTATFDAATTIYYIFGDEVFFFLSLQSLFLSLPSSLFVSLPTSLPTYLIYFFCNLSHLIRGVQSSNIPPRLQQACKHTADQHVLLSWLIWVLDPRRKVLAMDKTNQQGFTFVFFTFLLCVLLSLFHTYIYAHALMTHVLFQIIYKRLYICS